MNTNQKLQHTPGPWSYCGREIQKIEFLGTIFSSKMVTTKIATVEEGKDMEANIRLLRAAPELMEKLRSVLDCCQPPALQAENASRAPGTKLLQEIRDLLRDLDTKLPY